MLFVLIGLSASAQEKGDMSLGVNIGAAPCIESGASLTNFGIGAKFRYHVTSPVRLEANIDYWLKSKECDLLDFSVNAHYLFNVNDKINVFPIAGIGLAHIGGGFSGSISLDGEDGYYPYYGTNSYKNDIEPEFSINVSSNKMLINIGVGAEYTLTDKISIGAEIKYQYIKDFNRLPIKIGLTYKL